MPLIGHHGAGHRRYGGDADQRAGLGHVDLEKRQRDAHGQRVDGGGDGQHEEALDVQRDVAGRALAVVLALSGGLLLVMLAAYTGWRRTRRPTPTQDQNFAVIAPSATPVAVEAALENAGAEDAGKPA